MARYRRTHACCLPCTILILDPMRSIRFKLRRRCQKHEPPKKDFLDEDPLPPPQNRVKALAAVEILRKRYLRWRSDRKELNHVAINPQTDSLFLTHLPLEIRHRNYLELWREAGLEQHIVRREGRYIHLRYLVDQYYATDNRQSQIRGESRINPLGMPYVVYDEEEVWKRRLCSPWSNHWPCEEHGLALSTGTTNFHAMELRAPWLPLMRTCRNM